VLIETPEIVPSHLPAQAAAVAEIPVARPAPVAVQQPPAAKPTAPSAPGRLIFTSEQTRPPIDLKSEAIWMGRDPGCQIVFEAGAIMVSRRHAQVRPDNGGYVVDDNNSFNGTLVNGQRISSVTPLYHGDSIQLGLGGPVLRFDSPARVAPSGASLPGQRSISINQLVSQIQPVSSKTMVFNLEKVSAAQADGAQAQLLMSLNFGDKKELTIGRGEANDIKLDGLQISTRHARLVQTGTDIVIDDLGSTNGVYVNGTRDITRQAQACCVIERSINRQLAMDHIILRDITDRLLERVEMLIEIEIIDQDIAAASRPYAV
jgi:pSer/pThr/pTyr-binding forkhead associated (FHA) protein